MIECVNKNLLVPALIHVYTHTEDTQELIHVIAIKTLKYLQKAFQLSWIIQILQRQREVSININLESNTYCYLLAQETQHSGRSNSCFLQAETGRKRQISKEQTTP